MKSAYICQHLDFSLESRNVQTQNFASIQCTVWSRNVKRFDFIKIVVKTLRILLEKMESSRSDCDFKFELDANADFYSSIAQHVLVAHNTTT